MEALKAWKPELKILLTFFSPSGYEVRKNYDHADFVFYLPWDTKKNARWFAETVRPSIAIFVKYEFWYHYANTFRENGIPMISISAIFRSDQIFFRTYGAFFRHILNDFHYFFVQNRESIYLLHSIGITSVELSGDTRFDRVNEIARQTEKNPRVLEFKGVKKLMVIGSAWPADIDILIPFIHENLDQLQFIIAPHEIHESFLKDIERRISSKVQRYSNTGVPDTAASVLIIDNVGLLSQLYRYGDVAYVGGAFGKGLHNILEAACYGIPIFFGNKAYNKYQEAVDLMAQGGAFSVQNFNDLDEKYKGLMNDPALYQRACFVTRQYIQDNLGATAKISEYCKKLLG